MPKEPIRLSARECEGKGPERVFELFGETIKSQPVASLGVILKRVAFYKRLGSEMTKSKFFFVAAPRTSLAGLLSMVTALPCTDYKTEALDSLLSV